MTSPRAARQIRWIALIYALLPAVGGLLWLLLGDDDPLRNRAPVEFVPIFEGVVLLLALRAGLSRRSFAGSLTPLQRGALIGFALVAIAGLALNAPDPVAGAERLAFRLLHVAAAFSLGFLIWKAGSGARQTLTLALVAQPLLHLPVLAILYVLYVGDPEMNWLGGPVGYWHVRIWGMSLAVALAAGFGLYIGSRPGKAGHTAWAVVFALLGLLLAFSGFRGGILALPVAVGLCLVLAPKRSLGHLPLFVAATIAGAAASVLIPPPIPDYGLFNSVAETMSATSVEAASGGRLSLWAATIELIGQHPLLGHGHDQFRNVYTDGPLEYVQPHNVVLNLVFDFGLLGGAALAFLLLSLWWRGAMAARAPQGTDRLGGFAALSAIAAMAQLDGALYHPEPLLMTAVAFAALLARDPAPA